MGGVSENLPTKRDEIIKYIKEFIERGYVIHWNPLPDDPMIKVYVPELPQKIVNVDGDGKLIMDIRKEVMGN